MHFVQSRGKQGVFQMLPRPQQQLPCPSWRRSHVKPGKSQACSFCAVFSVADIFSCHCNVQYACLQCLVAQRTNPPPPRCPRCSGECVIRFKPIATVCLSGSHAILPNVKAWHCPMFECKFMACRKCCSQPSSNKSLGPRTRSVSPQASRKATNENVSPPSRSSSSSATHRLRDRPLLSGKPAPMPAASRKA